MGQFWHSAKNDGEVQEERPTPMARPDQTQRVAPTDKYIQDPARSKNRSMAGKLCGAGMMLGAQVWRSIKSDPR
jgi:hypothetical protein